MTTPEPAAVWMTKKQAAAYLKVSLFSFDKIRKEKGLREYYPMGAPARRPSGRYVVRWKKDDLDAWMESQVEGRSV